MGGYGSGVRSLPLGTTGLEVTRVIAGAARAPVPVRRGVDSLGEAWDLGVRALDVSDLGAQTETAAERFLEDRQPEDAVILAGIGGTARPDRGSDLSPERLERSFAAAVRRLGRLDLAWLGGSDAETPLEATLTALAAALDAGRMRGWGAGDADVWRLDGVPPARAVLGLREGTHTYVVFVRRGTDPESLRPLIDPALLRQAAR